LLALPADEYDWFDLNRGDGGRRPRALAPGARSTRIWLSHGESSKARGRSTARTRISLPSMPAASRGSCASKSSSRSVTSLVAPRRS
jgi:hypothetical protein